MRSLKLDPLVYSDNLLVPISLHWYVPPKEEQREGRDHGGVMEEDGRALHLGVVDNKLVVKWRLITVDRLWVEFDFSIVSKQLWWPVEYSCVHCPTAPRPSATMYIYTLCEVPPSLPHPSLTHSPIPHSPIPHSPSITHFIPHSFLHQSIPASLSLPSLLHSPTHESI